MEEIGSFIAKLVECLWDPISRHARYLFCFNKFIGDAEEAKGELKVKLAEVNMRKEDADRKAEEIMPSVKRWLEEVNVILEDVQKQQQELEGGGNKCSNVSLRYSLAKQMEEKARQMVELSNSSFQTFSHQKQLPSISTQFSSKEFMNFKSRESTYNSLLEAIKDGKNKMVGLCGMGGSGKTTLAIEVGEKVEQLKLFDKVFKVVVSQPLNVRNIQKQIMDNTGLEFKEEIESAVAKRLFDVLKSKKVLIILDDVWSDLKLEEIGVPLNENCCILLTTRRRDLCVSMSCERTVELSLLTREEAWDLFKTHAKPTKVSQNEFDSIGRKIVDACKGLPIAIVIVGSALKGKSIQVWKSIKRRLRRRLPVDIEDDLKTLYATLEVSYDKLPSQLAKSLFLLCSMFPEDHEIHKEDLIRFGKGTLKLQETILTMKDARIEILAALEILLDSCLLMHTDELACVKMHDLVRDVALWITKKQHQAILVDRHVVSRTLVESGTLKETKAISLWNLENNFKLSNQLHCPTLEILLLHPEWFIEDLGGIEALKVLALITSSFKWGDYYGRRIQWSMPQSIVSSLMNLHTVCFRGIALGDISFLCQLKRLEILDLHGSQFDELPGGIADMKKLKLLDIFGCEIGKSPLEVIQKCEELEELYLWVKKSAILENFSLLGLKRYVICDSTSKIASNHGYPSRDLDSCDEPLRALCVQGFKVSYLNSSMKDLILRANSLGLENCMWDHKDINVEIKHLLAVNCPEKKFIVESLGTNVLQTEQVFPCLITLKLREMKSLEQVFQDSSITCSLPMLQELNIDGCPELTTIFTHATIISLPKLRTLYIRDCNKVKCLFSYSLAAHCPSLEELQISRCDELERLIHGEVAHGDRLLHQRESHHDLPNYPYGNETERAFLVVTAKSFKQLQNHEVLTLFLRLKHVRIMWSMMRIKVMFEVQVRGIVESEDSVVEVQEEPLKLISLLCSLKLYDLKELEYIWKGPTQSVILHRLEEVTLVQCPKLRNIFTFAIVISLPELRTICITACEEWEGIFCEESLKTFSSSSNVCFPKLQSIEIRGCNKVKRLFSYSLASHCPSLEDLLIEDCSELESLVDEQASHEDILQPHGNETERAFLVVTAKSFKQLQNHEALTLFPILKRVQIARMMRNKGIIEVQVRGTIEGEDSVVEAQEPLKLIPELCSLDLTSLAELEYIWKGPTESVSLHKLEEVILWMCPKLRNIFTFVIVRSLPELRALKVYDCEEWEGIFCEESLKNLSSSSSSNVCFPKLQNIVIRKSNKVKSLFSYSLASHCPSLEDLHIEDCSELESLVDEQASHEDILQLLLKLKTLILKSLPKLREIFEGRFEHKLESLHNKQECSPHRHKNEGVQVVKLDLISINLKDLPEWEYIWKGPTHFVSLHRLEDVKLAKCPKLRNIFTLAIVTRLPELQEIYVSGCQEWEGIFCEESLENLSSSSSSNVCFPKLQSIVIHKCNKVKSLFSYSLASHCPSLEEITIKDCSQLERVVQAYEGEVVGHHEKLFPKLSDLKLKRLPKLQEIYSGYEFNHFSGTMDIRDCPNICNIPSQYKRSSEAKSGFRFRAAAQSGFRFRAAAPFSSESESEDDGEN